MKNNNYGFYGTIQYLALLISLLFTIQTSMTNAQWIQTDGPEGGYVLCFTTSGSNIYAGTDGGGVYVSTDGGSSWMQTNAGLKDFKVNAIAAVGKNLFATVENTWGGSGIYLSTNEGANWSRIGNGLPTDSNVVFLLDCLAAASNGKGGTNLFAGALDGGVYLSTDNGANWIPDTVGLINKFVITLMVDDTNLYAGTATGVYRSTTNATPWTSCAPKDMEYSGIHSIVVLGSSIFASGGGIYRSTDNGGSWTSISDSNTIGPMALFDTELVAGTVSGTILRSTDEGATWIVSHLPMAGVTIMTIASIDSSIYAGTYGGGVFLSTDRGKTWAAANSGMKNSQINAVAVRDSDIFAGAIAVGVFRSTDNGKTWQRMNKGLASLNVVGLAVSGSNLFAGIMPWPGGVFKSTDDGESWSQVGKNITGLYNTFALAAQDTILFAGALGPGVYRSTDDGDTWHLSNSGITNTGISALVASDKNLFAGTFGGGVFRSTDQGADWTSAGLAKHFVGALAFSGKNLYAKTLDAGLFVSADYGTNWTKFDSGSVGESIVSLAADSSNLYAGSMSGVIYRAVSGITLVRPSGVQTPLEFQLSQNYPNPFNPTTTIQYQIPKSGLVIIKVYDVLGREVKTLVNQYQQSGKYNIKFDASNFSSGVYFYQLRTGNFTTTKKLLLLK